MMIRIGYADTDWLCRYGLFMSIRIGYADTDWLCGRGLVISIRFGYAEGDCLCGRGLVIPIKTKQKLGRLFLRTSFYRQSIIVIIELF